MTDHPFKPILLDLLHQAHRDQDAFLQELNTTERAATGTPEYWSAKDHVAHLTFWRRHLVLMLQAIIRKVPQPESENFEQLNPVIFEEQRYRPWPDILSESDHVYAELITLSDQLTEEDLTAFNRFDWIPDGWPLYTSFMGNCYEHAQQHLAQYYLDHHDLPRAILTYEVWAMRVVKTEAPEFLKGYALYNLACFYATHAQLEKSSAILQQALTLAPPLTEWSVSDPDLIALRHPSDEG
jgi:hypothetical protein